MVWKIPVIVFLFCIPILAQRNVYRKAEVDSKVSTINDSITALRTDINTIQPKVDSLIYHVSQKTLKNMTVDGYEKYIQPIYSGVIDSLTYQSADSSFNFSMYLSDNPDGSDSTDIVGGLTATQTRQKVSSFSNSQFTKYQFIFIKINSVSGVYKERGFINLYTKEND